MPVVDENSRDIADAPLTVLADPVIEVIDPALASDWEGCLRPGCLVPRPPGTR